MTSVDSRKKKTLRVTDTTSWRDASKHQRQIPPVVGSCFFFLFSLLSRNLSITHKIGETLYTATAAPTTATRRLL